MAEQSTPRLMAGTAASVLALIAPAAAQPAPGARPAGGVVIAGSATIGQNAAQTTVDQSSQRAAVDWRSFDVGSQHTVTFQQPSANAVTLNRVTGPDPSQIAGRIVANGNVVITNPSGVAFSRGAQVDVNGIIVSAPGISTQNFMAGRMVFDQASKPGATVSNAGAITVKQAGLAALVAPQVANSGVINARLGRAVLAGAEAHTIDLYGDGLVALDVTKAVTRLPAGPGGAPAAALVTNTGTVIADGGSVQITAHAADGLIQDLVRAGGTIRANMASGRTGRIDIAGVGGSVRVEGRVSADGGAGGTISVTASDTVTVARTAAVSAQGRTTGGAVALGTTPARALAGRQAGLGSGASPPTPAGTARRVVVEAGATVSADGKGAGNGGTVAALSTRSTRIDGRLSARGGRNAGRGGVIEASSDGVLALNGKLDAGAPAGGGGVFLDPYDLVIGAGSPAVALGGPVGDPSVPQDGATSLTSYISPNTLSQAAQNGAVRISLSANHDLTVAEPVNLGPTGTSLALHAGHDLVVGSGVALTGAESLDLSSGSSGAITLGAGSLVQTRGSGAIQIRSGAAGTSMGGTVDGGAVTLASAGAVQQGTGGAVKAANIGGVAASYTLTGSGNRIGVLTAEASGDIAVTNAQTLRIDVARAAGNVTVTTSSGDLYVARASNTSDGSANGVTGAVVALRAQGNLLFESGSHPDNVVQATTRLALNAGGLVTQDSGAIVTPVLTGYASGAALAQGGNRIGTLGTFVVSGDLRLSDSAPLTIGGVVAVGTGRTLAFATDSLQFGVGGALSAPGGVLAIAPLTAGHALSLTGPTSGAILADTVRLGSVTAGDIGLAGTIALTDGATLDLRSAGNIVEAAGGVVQAGTLTGQANSVTLTGANRIGTLGDVSVAGLNLPAGVDGALRLRNDQPLAVAGSVTATASNIVIDTSASSTADVTIAAPIRTVGGDFVVYAGRNITVANGATIGAPNGGIVLEASFGANDPAASGAVRIDAGLSARNVILGAGAGGIDVAANVTGSNTVVLRGQGSIDPALIDLYRGAITQSGGTITTPQLGARGTSVVLNGGNQIAGLGSSAATAGDFVLATAAGLAINAPVVVAPGRTIAIASDGLRFSGGGLTAPGGLIALAPAASGGGFTLGGVVAAGGVTADTLRVGAGGPVSLAGTLGLDGVGTLELRSIGAISQQAGSSVSVGTLTVAAGSASLAGGNSIGTLGAFTVAGGLALTDTGTLVVGGPGSAGSLALTTGGAVRFAGAIGVGGLSVEAGGAVTQTGGTLRAATLSGSAGAVAEFGVGGSATIDTLAGFSVLGGAGTSLALGSSSSAPAFATPTLLRLANAGPLTVTGPISAGTVVLTAPGAMTLQGGQFAADNVLLSVTSAAGGGATIAQTGSTSFASLSNTAGALGLVLPGSGAVTLQGLNAAGMSVTLGLGRGTAAGTLSSNALQVFGQGGSAGLTGTVAGRTGAAAAALAAISPTVDANYKLNGCTLAVLACGVVTGAAPAAPIPTPSPAPIPTPGPTPVPPIARPGPSPAAPVRVAAALALLAPRAFLATELGNTLQTGWPREELITIGIADVTKRER